MEPDELLKLLRDHLQTLAGEVKAHVTLASDPWNMLELLSENPAGARFILHWDGDDNVSQSPEAASFCDNVIEIGVTANPGLTVQPDRVLMEARPGAGLPILQLVARVRRHMREIDLPAEVSEGRIRYAGCKPVTLPDGTPLKAFRLRFLVVTAPEAILHP